MLNRRSAGMSAREFESRSHRWVVGMDQPPCQPRWSSGQDAWFSSRRSPVRIRYGVRVSLQGRILRSARSNYQTREEDRPWPTSGTGSECLVAGPVLRSRRGTRCGACCLPAGMCSGIGSRTVGITCGANPSAPTGRGSCPCRSNAYPRTGSTRAVERAGRCMYSVSPVHYPSFGTQPPGDGITPGPPKARFLVRLQAGGRGSRLPRAPFRTGVVTCSRNSSRRD